MRLHQIDPTLWVGSCPVDAEDSRALAAQGIGAVLSLQTDTDLKALGLRWEVLWGSHIAAGLAVERVPIRDFDKKDLGAQVELALAALARLGDGGRAVYLHCTAGLNRSPTIAIAALAERYDLDPDAASELLMRAHPGAVPYVDALQRWWKVRARARR
ncbi:MAG: dual specificity protein phosphatase family protein [Myxococcota bacterium]